MAEPVFASPVTSIDEADPGAELALADHSTLGKIVVRAAAGTAAEADLDTPFGTSRIEGAGGDGVIVAGTRPDEWMLLGHVDSIARRAGEVPREGHVSLVDWTHGRAAFRLTGTDAARALEKVCSIDWSDAMTPDGAVLSASIAGVGCDVIRNDIGERPSYLILCDRSFGQYLFDAILDVGEEFDIAVGV